MSRNANRAAPAQSTWLTEDESRTWIAFIRIQLRMSYEMNRQLQADSGLSLSDYHVLTALSNEPNGRMQITTLANQIGWERSRTSHHIRRMEKRGLVESGLVEADHRATEVVLADEGWRAIESAAPGHVALVRRLFFSGLPGALAEPLTNALESIYGSVVEHGSLPRPGG